MTSMSEQQAQTPAHHDDHGSTPAAWTTVTITMVAFVIGTLAIIIGNWPLFWFSVALVAVAAVVGAVMAAMGMGKKKS
ncbi:MAG: HGxxPAAW family protein [Actinomycetes bacterium]